MNDSDRIRLRFFEGGYSGEIDMILIKHMLDQGADVSIERGGVFNAPVENN